MVLRQGDRVKIRGSKGVFEVVSRGVVSGMDGTLPDHLIVSCMLSDGPAYLTVRPGQVTAVLEREKESCMDPFPDVSLTLLGLAAIGLDSLKDSRDECDGEAECPFSLGQVVQLRSGGCKMTVSDFDEDGLAFVDWIEEGGKPHTDYFPTECLIAVE